MEPTKALTHSRDTFKGLMEKMKGQMAAVLPRHVTPERMVKVALVAASRNPRIYECTPHSIARCMMDCSQLGLEPGGPLQAAHLVPFKNSKIGKYETQLIVGYRGLIELARRGGKVESIEAHVVHKADRFKCQYGAEPVLEHEPVWEGDPGDVIAAYAVAKLKGGGCQWDVMTRTELDKIRNSSKARNAGPWVDWPEEMQKKTVVKRLCKYLPLSPELATAIEIDNQTEAVIDTDFTVTGSAESANLTAGRHEHKKKPAKPEAKAPEVESPPETEPEPEFPKEPEAPAFDGIKAVEEIEAWLHETKDITAFDKACEACEIDPAKWQEASNTRLEILLGKVRDLGAAKQDDIPY